MNCALRNVEQDDHDWLIDLHNDQVVLHNLTDPRPVTKESHAAWWSEISKTNTQLRFIFTVDNERVGFAKFIAIDYSNRNCLLGGDIHKIHRGKGYAKKMWALMLHEAFVNLKLHRVGLTTAEYNEVGQHVYESLGFKIEGKLTQHLYRNDRYYDQICMYMLREDWVNS